MMAGQCALYAVLVFVTFAFAASIDAPSVNLSYSIYQASTVKAPTSSNLYYNFSNIRYAAPPIGALRFRAPQPPLDALSAGIQDGSYGNICPQGFPAWLSVALETNQVSYYDNIGTGQTEAEDCLFLDVIVPERVFRDGRQQTKPVLVWLYGGGFVNGDKRSLTDPMGLLESARGSLIFVAPNYRLGAFGWLAGSNFRAQGGDSNAGLLDQRAALEWVQKYIHHFGGDPKRVTLMGESAGGGSILNHLVAPNTSSLFGQVIAQSPVILPRLNSTALDATFGHFLHTLNVSTLEEVRKLPSEDLLSANQEVIQGAFYGSYVFGPAADGPYVPDLPNKLLTSRALNVAALVGHNSHEGSLFVDPSITTDSAFNAYISKKLFSFLLPASQQHIISALYPARYDGSNGYKTVKERLGLMISEAFIDCNAFGLANATAHRNGSFGYVFSVPPGLHGQDIAYSFFTPGKESPNVENITVAMELQRYLTRFARTGDPNADGDAPIPDYKQAEMILKVGSNGSTSVRDDMMNMRCRWWQKNL